MNDIVVITGPSCVGKTTMAKQLADNTSYRLVNSITTRDKRDDDVNYDYVSREEFIDMVSNGLLLDYSVVNDNYYGILKSEIQPHSIIVTNVCGALNIKKQLSGVKTIFISSDIVELVLRIKISNRDQKEERVKEIKNELRRLNFFDCVIINNDLSFVYDRILNFLNIKIN